jgi:hypothetical protein
MVTVSGPNGISPRYGRTNSSLQSLSTPLMQLETRMGSYFLLGVGLETWKKVVWGALVSGENAISDSNLILNISG